MPRSRLRSLLLVLLSSSALAATTACSSSSGDDDDDGGESGASGDTGTGGTSNGGSSGKGGSAAQGGTSGTSGKGGSAGKGGTSGTSGTSGKGGSAGSSGGAGVPPNIDELPPEAEAAWTVFVYGHGDHNLSNSLLADLGEMAKAELGEPGTFNLIVLTDWNASQTLAGSDPPVTFPTGSQLFQVLGSGAELEVVAETEELNLDDPDVLASLTSAVFKAFPARHHGIVLWDHGGAWSGGFGHDSQDGTDASPTGLPAENIPPAILAGLTDAGVSGKPPLDFLAFDTCLMAGAEVAYPFKALASVYIANAEIDYGNGWDYTATFTYLAANTDASPTAFGKAEVSHWNAHHESASTNDALLRSHAAIDLTKLEDFATAASDLSSAISSSSSFDPVDLGRGGFLALPPYASQFENAGSTLPGLHDAGQVLDALAKSDSDPDVATAATKARSALEALVIATSQGSLRSDADQSGVHIELSAASTLTTATLNEYKQLAASWDKATAWSGVLATLAAGADSEPPTFTHTVDNADGASASAPPLLHFSTTDVDAAKTTVYLGRDIDADNLALLGLVASAAIEPNEEYDFGWDGTVATFADDQPAMLDIWLDTGSAEGDLVLMIPGLLDGADEESLVTYLVFSSSESGPSVAVVSLGDVASTLTVSELSEAAPNATFSPLYYVITRSTGESQLVAGDPMPLPSSGTFELKAAFANASSYYLFTSMSDVWGNQGVAADAFQLAEPLGP